MSVYVIGEFQRPEAVAGAIRRLRDGGAAPADLDVFSEEPVPLPRGVLDRPGRMSLAGVAGALAFGALATAFIDWSQHNYRLPTGGMPLFSFWATGVITYEMVMLGAIVATFAWFLWESGLARRRGSGAPVPRVPPGAICLRVRCAGETAWHVIEILRAAGAADIARRGEA